MSPPMLTIHNNHTPQCGDPPTASNAEGTYVGYFENVYGEQWIFTYDHQTKAAYLQGGHIGWDARVEVIDGRVPRLVMQPDEAMWLRCCCNPARGELAR